MTDPRVPVVDVSGHMFTASSETDSSGGSNDGIVELNSEQRQEDSLPPPTAMHINQDQVESEYERSKGDPKRKKPVDMDGIVFGLRPTPAGRCQFETTTTGAGSEPGARVINAAGGAPAIATAGGAPAIAAAGNNNNNNNSGRQSTDNFGIKYRPSPHGPKKGYELPSGPAFFDEDEFEQEMSAEFRVASGGVSESGGQIPATQSGAESERTDDEKCLDRPRQEIGAEDFDEGPVCSSGSQQSPGCAVGVTTSTACGKDVASTTLSSNEDGDCDRSKPIISEDSAVKGPNPDDINLDNAEALRQLTDRYKKGGSSSTPQKLVGVASQSGSVVDATGAGKEEKSNGNNRGLVHMHVGGSAQPCPAIEEGNEEEEEEGGEEGDENGQGREGEEGSQREEGPEQLQIPCQSEEDRGEEVGEGGQGGGVGEEEGRLIRAAKEWEQIDQLRTAENSVPMEKGVSGTLQPVSINENDRIVCTADVLGHFRAQDLDEHKASIIPFQPRQTRFGLFRRAPKFNFPEAEQLRDEVFRIAKIHYTPKDVLHRRLIQTIYRRLAKEKRACPDVGPHWDTIGFQGSDPCTDLNRSMGVLSLLQVLYLLETQPAFAAVIFRHSTADVTGWPFLCVSIGFTKGAVDVLRQGVCYGECNRRKSVMEVVHELHQAQFHAFLVLCREEPATHHAMHLAKVRTLTENDSPSIVKAYRSYLSDEKAKSAMKVMGKAGGDDAGHELLGFHREEAAQSSRKRVVSSGSREVLYTTGPCQEDSGNDN